MPQKKEKGKENKKRSLGDWLYLLLWVFILLMGLMG